MGNYERTTKRIEELKQEMKRLKAELELCELGSDEFESLSLEIVELDQEIGENEGYLQELASMDGYGSYDEYLENAFYWE